MFSCYSETCKMQSILSTWYLRKIFLRLKDLVTSFSLHSHPFFFFSMKRIFEICVPLVSILASFKNYIIYIILVCHLSLRPPLSLCGFPVHEDFPVFPVFFLSENFTQEVRQNVIEREVVDVLDCVFQSYSVSDLKKGGLASRCRFLYKRRLPLCPGLLKDVVKSSQIDLGTNCYSNYYFLLVTEELCYSTCFQPWKIIFLLRITVALNLKCYIELSVHNFSNSCTMV